MAVLTITFAPRTAGAQVIEPNGLQVPAACPAFETCLQAYFDQLNPPEPIDATADASTGPGTFSPLCSFQAQLILSQSSGVAGLAWYNVPNDETSPPSATYPIIAETAMVGTMVSSAAIRSDPRYAGGLIGFALMEQGQPVYYSEYKRNVFCSGCAMPDHWKLMLAYPSELASNAYYLAFEDWAGANATGWAAWQRATASPAPSTRSVAMANASTLVRVSSATVGGSVAAAFASRSATAEGAPPASLATFLRARASILVARRAPALRERPASTARASILARMRSVRAEAHV